MKRTVLGLAVVMAVLPLASAAQTTDASVRPFTVPVPDAVLSDLKARLANPRLQEPLQGDGWSLGTDVKYLRELVDGFRAARACP